MASAEKAMFTVTDLGQANAKSPRGLSEREQKLRLSVNFRPVNLKQILAFIEIQDIDPELKVLLSKQVSRYPGPAIQRFADNFEQMVNVAQRKIRKTYAIDVEDLDKSSNPQVPVVKSKQDEKPFIKPKKISFSELQAKPETTSSLLETPVESLDGVPVSVSVAVNVNNTPVDVPKPKPKQKPMVFSAQLRDEDFE